MGFQQLPTPRPAAGRTAAWTPTTAPAPARKRRDNKPADSQKPCN